MEFKNRFYNLTYKNVKTECIYFGKTKKNVMNKDLVLMNICPNSERLPLKFYLFYIKNPKAKNNNLYYDSLRKVKLNNLEQEFINEKGKEIWNKKLL